MHVLHVTPYLAPAWAFGPVPQRVFELARAQSARGLTVTVLTTDAHFKQMGFSLCPGPRAAREKS